MALDTRWKNPQGKSPEQLHDAIVQIVRELRKSDYLPTGFDADAIAFSPTGAIAATDVQAAIAELDSEKQAAATAATQGKTSLWIPASIMEPVAGATLTNINFNSSGVIMPVRAFDPTTIEFAFFPFALPKSWNEGTISAQFYWSHPATVTNFGVRWELAASAFGNDDAISTAYAVAAVNDTGGTTDDLYITAETGALTPAGTAAEGDLLALYAARIANDATNDTLAVDAYLIGIKLFYTTNAGNDA